MTTVALAACSSGGETGALPSLPSLPMPKVELPKVDLSKVEIPKVELPEVVPPAVGRPTEVYTRIARGALGCWFGASGPLKNRYIYHADAESPAKGGRAEIAIHERDATAKDPRGAKAARISIEPEGEGTKVSYENTRITGPLAETMRRDVDRWAADRTGCQPPSDPAAWNPETKGAPAEPLRAAKPAARQAKTSH